MLIKMTQKDRVSDYFKDTIIETNKGQSFPLYVQKSASKFIKEKRQKTFLHTLISRYRLIIGLKCQKNLLFIKCLLEKIEITKKLFLLEIQDGGEVFIPKDLS